ncbi:MAG: YraN family protein [Ignavibacteriota bacterium]|nr:YraN family protein [Ignavibacteriota bacterium]
MSDSGELGKWGEQYAKEELLKKGLKFIASNFRFKKLEIDLVFFDKVKDEIIFVEVKTRTSDYFGEPEEAINSLKQRKLKNCASVFLKINKEFENCSVRYDSYGIVKLKDEIKVRHTEDSF